jgi:protoheme IX farnesyltransferase
VVSTLLLWAVGGALAGAVGLATIVFYVGVYTMYLKPRTPQNIVIGGAAGGFPPIAGWAAVTGEIGLAAVALFLIIFVWTPPHFWALALERSHDYARVGVPMLPVVAGQEKTRRHILAYTLALLPVSLLPWWLGLSSWMYALTALGLGGGFVRLAVRLWRDGDNRTALRTFRYSVVYLFGLFLALMLDEAIRTWGPAW